MKGKIRLFSIALTAVILVTACSEAGKEDEYHDWQARNEAYTDSLAQVVTALEKRGVNIGNATEGDMFRILSYKLDPSVSDWGADNYVYCKVVKKGNGSVSPIFSDSISINYRGRLIPTSGHPEGFVFEQTYKTAQITPESNVPGALVLSELVPGMVTAISCMKKGDIWRITIPYRLGYGKTKKSSIPAYSNLIFDLHLADFSHGGSEIEIK